MHSIIKRDHPNDGDKVFFFDHYIGRFQHTTRAPDSGMKSCASCKHSCHQQLRQWLVFKTEMLKGEDFIQSIDINTDDWCDEWE